MRTYLILLALVGVGSLAGCSTLPGPQAAGSQLDHKVSTETSQAEKPKEVSVTPTVTVETASEANAVSDLPALIAEAQKHGMGSLVEQSGRHYYAVNSKTQTGAAYKTVYPIKDNKLAARLIVLQGDTAESPGCNPQADQCIKLQLARGAGTLSFNTKDTTRSYAYATSDGIRESGYFSPAEGVSPLSLNQVAQDLKAAGLISLDAWEPLPESKLQELLDTDLSGLGLAVGQNGIRLDNKLGFSPRWFSPSNTGLILTKAHAWKFGRVPAQLSPLTSYLDFDAEGRLAKLGLFGTTQSLQAKADKTCLALADALGPAAVEITQTVVRSGGAMSTHNWWWLDNKQGSLLRCVTVDTSNMGFPDKTQVGLFLSPASGNAAPVFSPAAVALKTSASSELPKPPLVVPEEGALP